MPVFRPFTIVAFAICVLAAFRLRVTPLWSAAAAVALVNAVAWCATAVLARAGRSASRALTALQHVTAALGGFFLFVSFALP